MKKTSKNTNMGMALGMCLGVGVGTALGSVFENMAMGTSLGLCIGMVIGLMIGAEKDRKANRQMEEKGYTVRDIRQNGAEYSITIADKGGTEQVVTISKGEMEEESFEIGDVVFLDDDGSIEQAYDKEDE